MTHDNWIQLAIGIVLLLLTSFVGVLGWIVNRFVGDLDKLEADQEECDEEQQKHSLELRDTRQAISRIEGKLDMEPFPYTSE